MASYKELYQIWKHKRSGPGWRPQQSSETTFRDWIYDKIVSMNEW